MKLKLSLEEPGDRGHDILIDADPHAPVATIAAWISLHRSSNRYDSRITYTLAIIRPSGRELLPPDSLLQSCGLRSGDRVAVSDASQYSAVPVVQAASLRVVAGPDAGMTVSVPAGSSTIGRDRDCAVRLKDQLISKHHARLNVSNVVEIIDMNSANGTVVAGALVSRAVVGPDDHVVLGDTTFVVSKVAGASAANVGAIPFNRSPRLDPAYEGVKLVAPEPPSPPQRQHLPVSMLLMPILMGAVLYAVTRNPASVLFIAMSPLMMIGSYFEQKKWAKRSFVEAVELFRSSTTDLVVQMQAARDDERALRCREHPATRTVVGAAIAGQPLLWTRRPDRRSFLDVAFGIGDQPSRSSIEMPVTRNTVPELWAELNKIAADFRLVDRVPVVGSFRASGAFGVGGVESTRLDVARGLVAQLAALHSPAELAIGAIISPASLPEWGWLKWLPHSSSDFSPVSVEHLCTSGPAGTALVASLEDLIDERAEELKSPDAEPPSALVVLIEDGAPVERARLVALAEEGPAAGVYTLWVGASLDRLPAVCERFLEVDHNTGVSEVGNVIDGEFVTPVIVSLLSRDEAEVFGRALSPLVDAGALLDDQTDLPNTVSFVGEVGKELATDPSSVTERWLQSQVAGSAHRGGTRERNLRAFVGSTASGPLFLDLRTHGPHALVGGTTGSGKSEFLQTWLIAMATAHGPERVNFLLVDYKGGSAFGSCAELPHSVGLVTDLTPRLVRRALISLRAELTRRERVLQQWRAKDLMDLEAKEPDGAPVIPSLVIVVDEFAALIQEIPEFVDGMIDIAQRGRSLGLHLVLATQRPTGVIKGNLRANTNLRIALRMADTDDSMDVVGSFAAADFDPGTPGRALAKTGPGKITPFQAAYVGGWTTDEVAPPVVKIVDFPFGVGEEWEPPNAPERGARDLGERDLDRVVTNVVSAFQGAHLAPPRRPWLPELAARYELSQLPTRRTDDELVFAVRDEPTRQAQSELAFHPDIDGNIAAFGTGGSGKSTFLRTLGIAAGLSVRGGPCVVYGIDFGARGLSMLSELPHVGSIIGGDDDERLTRLIRQLRDTIDERAERYSAVKAGSIVEYRKRAQAPDEMRVLLLVDGAGAFRQQYELGPRGRVFDQFLSLAIDGRQVGVHVALAGDRPNSIPASLLSAIPHRLVLRTADEMDLAMMGVPVDGFDTQAPAGRGFFDDYEIQVAVLGGTDASVAEQSSAIDALAHRMRQAGVADAPEIERLSERILLVDLPANVGELPALGIADETLEPVGFAPHSAFVVCGPPDSGKTSVTMTLVESLRRWRPSLHFVYLGNRRSPIGAMTGWRDHAADEHGVAEIASRLTDEIRGDDADPRSFVIVIDNVSDFLATSADMELQDLIRTGRTSGATVIVTDETSNLSQSWPLFKEARASRHGIALQPDQMDGDAIFSTTFGRMQRSEFPQGRGIYVRAGKTTRVQVALPE